ncbi:hypothetical protein HPB52_023803 [Rhipicephalus sanguineus]|uniref:Uncharacterized protein n=1 Tax=Rhipicephalus sanguineus TaxID=34632 RepID=A0A9D4T0L0_RHISA|nr:hypothetical protein HPB52_023803 [Rhipicephalus sanguineus]
MDGSPSHGPEKHTPPTPETAAAAATAEHAAGPLAEREAQAPAEDAPKQTTREGKKRRRRGSRSQKHKGKTPSPRRLHQSAGLSEPRVVQGSSSEHTHPGNSDDCRQSLMDAHREENTAPTERVINQENGHDEETSHTTHGHASKHRRKSRHEDRSPDTNAIDLSVMEARPGLRCPPHQFSEIVAALHRSAAHQETQKNAYHVYAASLLVAALIISIVVRSVDKDRSLKYCVVVSLFVLLCLYYAGFLTAYMLLSAQPQQRPSGRTVEQHYTQWAFKTRTSRQPESGNPPATTDVGGTTQEGAQLPPKAVSPIL